MIPLVSSVEEFLNQKKNIKDCYNDVVAKSGLKVDYLVGTMIELPRACLISDKIAKHADFLSFGTNDLTQTLQWLEDGSHSWRALSTSQVAAVTLATELPKGLFQVVFGLAGDRFGRKKFLVGGLGLSGLAVALMGIVGASSGSDVYTAFCFLGVLLGIGTSAMYTNCQAAVADMSRPQWRSTAVGTLSLIHI